MAIKRAAAAAGFCVLAASGAMAEKPQQGQPLPAVQNVAPAATSAPARDQSWPIVLKKEKDNGKVKLWSKADIDAAQARCMVLLKDVVYEADYEAPLREGNVCGTPAPMRLLSIGSGASKVTFSPPPTVSCDLIMGLAKWLDDDVQKLARKHLGGPLTRVETMSSYSCRNAYGRSEGRLSEHGRANALDISSFGTERLQVVSIEADWGMTQREIAAARQKQQEVGETTISAIKPATVPTVATSPAKPRPEVEAAAIVPAPGGLQDMRPSIPGIMLMGQPQAPMLGFDAPSRLGGPKPKNAPAAVIPPPPPASTRPSKVTIDKTTFLREAHKAGCRIFGTVLGPEANNTHRNHFHVDMAERAQNTKICE